MIILQYVEFTLLLIWCFRLLRKQWDRYYIQLAGSSL
jgi:hypothetical protein